MKKIFKTALFTIVAFFLCILLFPTSAQAASEGDLKFKSNSGGQSYYVSGCNLSASGELVIPSTYNGKPVTVIGVSAFEGCTSLTSVTIPDSVTSIGDRAFRDCRSLTSITIPDSVTDIGDFAFYNCSCMTSITIPESVTKIGNDAFRNCSSLTSITIAEGVTSIGSYAFSSCSSLSSITIPDGVSSIGKYAFSFCSSLTSITFGNSVTSIGASVLRACSSLISVTIPDSVTSLGASAFEYCTSLTSITIGDSVTSIGEYAFCNCSSLASITIPDSVTNIGGYAFQACTGLTSITIGEGVTSIGAYAFKDCTGLTSIIIGEGVTSIGAYAFKDCRSLTNVDIADVGVWCRIQFGNLSANPFYYARNLYLNGELLTNLDIPDSVTNILESTFYNCKSLTSVTIPDSVTRIDDDAFYNCTSLTSVIVGDGVTSIGSSAFYNCSSLISAIIGDSVTSIGASAFSKCNSLTSITIGDHVTSIGASAFYNCSSLESITIPERVTSIGDDAFKDCSSLMSITIPEGVISIGNNTFRNCNSLEEVYYKGTAESKEKISIGSNNKPLSSAQWHYISENQIEGEVVYWCDSCGIYHYSDGSRVPLQQLTVATLPNVVRYAAGDTLSIVGISLVGTYANGTELHLTAENVESVSADMETYGKKTVTVTAMGASTTFEIFVTTSEKIVVDPSLYPYPESSHNYSNNLNETKEFTYAGATSLTITFNSSTKLQSNYDYIYVYDGIGAQVAKYTGTEAANKTLTIPGDTFKIRLTSNGITTYYGYAFSNIVASIPTHKPSYIPATVTCTQGGLTEGSYCEICGEVLVAQEEVSALGHDFVHHNAQEPSCTEIGWNAYETCNRCDYTTYAEKPALGHKDGNPVIENRIEPTCTVNGSYEGAIYCKVCGTELYRAVRALLALGHKYEATFNWSENHRSCTATITCDGGCNLNKVVDCTVIHSDANQAQTVHTASTEYKKSKFSDTLTCVNYLISFKDWDGSEISSAIYHYGDEVVVPSNPTRAAANGYTYTFSGWDQEITACDGNKVYTATYKSWKFADVSTSSWQINAVVYACDRGLMAGKGTDADGIINFAPNSAITREEFVQVLYNAENKPSISIANNFPDVKNAWYKNAVLWANEVGIASGMGNGNFGIGKNITRQDLAMMLYKYAKMKGCSLDAEEGKINQFADSNKVANYAKTAMDWAVTNGVLSGKGESGKPLSTFRLDPTGTATRAECAAMLKNFMEAFGL